MRGQRSHQSLPGTALAIVLLAVPLFAANARFVQKTEGAGYVASTLQAAEGSYVTASLEETGVLVSRILISGQKLWETRLEFEGDYVNLAGIVQTSDSRFILVGQIECINCEQSIPVVLKLDANGKLKWKKAFSVSASNARFSFRSAQPLPDGGFVVVGEAGEEQFMVRFTSAGDILWTKEFSGMSTDFVDLVSTEDNGLALLFSRGNNIAILKLDDAGNVAWKRQLKIPFNITFLSVSAAPARHNGIVIAGGSFSSLRGSGIFLIGVKGDGAIAWKKRFSLPDGSRSDIYISSISQSPDKGFLLSAILEDAALLLKIDSSREIVFQNVITDLFGDFLIGRSIFQTPDGGYLLFGNSAFDDGVDGLIPMSARFVLKLDSRGTPASCISTEPANLKAVPFGPIEMRTSFSLQVSNTNVLHEKGLVLKSSLPGTKTSIICR